MDALPLTLRKRPRVLRRRHRIVNFQLTFVAGAWHSVDFFIEPRILEMVFWQSSHANDVRMSFLQKALNRSPKNRHKDTLTPAKNVLLKRHLVSPDQVFRSSFKRNAFDKPIRVCRGACHKMRSFSLLERTCRQSVGNLSSWFFWILHITRLTDSCGSSRCLESPSALGFLANVLKPI